MMEAKRILLVLIDDFSFDCMLLGYLKDVLRFSGFTGDTVIGLEQARRALEAEHYDVMLIDERMVKNGTDALLRVREFGFQGPVLLLNHSEQGCLARAGSSRPRNSISIEARPSQMKQILDLATNAA